MVREYGGGAMGDPSGTGELGGAGGPGTRGSGGGVVGKDSSVDSKRSGWGRWLHEEVTVMGKIWTAWEGKPRRTMGRTEEGKARPGADTANPYGGAAEL